jgi:hypothetical protein
VTARIIDRVRGLLDELGALTGDGYAVIAVERELADRLRNVPQEVWERELPGLLPHLRRIARVHGR